MANSFVTSPYFIDTVMAVAWPPGVGWVFIEDISWTDQGASGDQLIIKDRNGNIIVDAKASGANVLERFGKMNRVNGIQVTTLATGKVMVYLR